VSDVFVIVITLIIILILAGGKGKKTKVWALAHCLAWHGRWRRISHQLHQGTRIHSHIHPFPSRHCLARLRTLNDWCCECSL
jgi:hypothetical protein